MKTSFPKFYFCAYHNTFDLIKRSYMDFLYPTGTTWDGFLVPHWHHMGRLIINGSFYLLRVTLAARVAENFLEIIITNQAGPVKQVFFGYFTLFFFTMSKYLYTLLFFFFWIPKVFFILQFR